MVNSQVTLSYKQQLRTTILISIAFMMIFTAYTSVQGIVTKFYQSNNHQYYGRISLITIYTLFALSTTYSSSIIKALGYKTIFIGGTLCYTVLNSSALIIYFTNSQFVAVSTIIITSCLCGTAAGNIWVAQNSYMGQISSKENLSTMFSIFQGIRSFSQIIGCILTFYVFKYYDGFTFFSILIPLGLSSSLILYFLPEPKNSRNYQRIEDKQIQGLQKIKKYFKLLQIKQNYQIYIYQCLNSIPQTIISVFAFKIVDSSVVQEYNQSEKEYHERLTYLLGFTLLWAGVGRCIFSFLTKKITDYIDCFQFCYLSSVCSIVAIIVGAISYYLSSLWICCLFTFLLGIVYATSRNSCNLLLKQVFQNDLDLIGINYFVSSISFIGNVILITFLTKISINLCLLIYFMIFIYIANCTRKIPTVQKGQKLISSIEMQELEK